MKNKIVAYIVIGQGTIILIGWAIFVFNMSAKAKAAYDPVSFFLTGAFFCVLIIGAGVKKLLNSNK